LLRTRDVAEFPDHLGVAEVAGCAIPAAAEGDGADVAFLARHRLGFHDRGVRIEALDGFGCGDAVVGEHER
jgi:hypothetical protein